VLDDKLNVLPVSRHAKSLVPLATAETAGAGGGEDDEGALDVPLSESERALRDLKSRCAGGGGALGVTGGDSGSTRTPILPSSPCAASPRQIVVGSLRRSHAHDRPGEGSAHLR